MTLAEQLRDDFLAFEMLEDFTFEPRNSDDTYGTPIATRGLFRTPKRNRFGPSVSVGDVTIHLDAVPLVAVDVELGGRITRTTGSTKWLIVSAVLESLSTRARCECIKETA